MRQEKEKEKRKNKEEKREKKRRKKGRKERIITLAYEKGDLSICE